MFSINRAPSFEQACSPEGRSREYFSFMSPPRPRKQTLFKKVRSSVRYLKETIFLSNCKGLRLYYRVFVVTKRFAGFIVGRQGKR